MFGTRLKILTSYALLATMLVSATWMTYDNTRSLNEVSRASEELVARRDAVDSLVCSMLATANAERSIMLGDIAEWPRFDHAISASTHMLRRLRPMLADSAKRERLDSLAALLNAKRANTLLVMEEVGKNQSGIYYNRKVEALRSGRDSMVIRPKTEQRHTQQETIYEVVKSRRGFLRRLGDAFRRQHTDTIGTTHIARATSADSTVQKVDIADSVANALSQIQREQRKANSRQLNTIATRNQQLQLVSVQLARRTGELLNDIQADEQDALRRAVGHATTSRQHTIARIAAFGLLAIISSTILILYILRDIRRERHDRQRILEAKAQTERLMQQREQLLLTITHDIKAPAASIAGFTDLLANYTQQPKAMGYLSNIASSARHLQQLVSALLDYHQLESGKAEMHMSSFSPAQLIGKTVEELQPMAHERKLTLRADIKPCSCTTCRSDAFRIKQILTNLIGNALKYTDKGGVTVAMEAHDGHVTISVADTGRGMTNDEQQRIFNAFTRLPDAQGREGVGLGLSITRRLVEMLGGRIDVKSTKGQGSTFTVSIPVEADGNGQAAVAPGMPSKESTVCNNTLKVVIIDDDSLQIQLLCEMLRQLRGANIDIRHTTHVGEAVEMIGKDRPHLLFTDVEMPEMNGSDMLRLVGGKDMKAIAMTAHEESIMPRLRRDGFDACLFKPFDTQALAATICQLTHVKLTSASMPGIAPLLAFAEGDKEAERQIMADLGKSIDEYIALLADADDKESVARAAHKAMPLLEMLRPGDNEWLRPITPEHIVDTQDNKRHEIVARLKDELAHIL